VKSSYDFAILGGGIAGVSAAYFLSKTAKVALIEREPSWGFHASGRSAAVFIEAYDNFILSDLTLDSKDFFINPDPEFSKSPIVQPLGGVTVFRPDELEQAQSYLTHWQTRCPSLRLIDQSDAVSLIPILKAEAIAGAIYDPNLLSIDTHQLLQCMLRGVRKHGGQLFCGIDSEPRITLHNIWEIDVGKVSVRAPVLINAAGAWGNEVALMAGQQPLPLTPARRTAAVIKVPGGAPDWPMLKTFNQQLYVKPEQPGLLVSPQDETPSAAADAYPEELDLAVAIERFEKLCEFSVSRIHRSWAGLRTLTPDRRPVLGFANTEEKFFWIAGQGGAGIQTAPALGRIAADALIHGAAISSQLDPCRFARADDVSA